VAAAFQDALTTRLGRTAFPHCASWYREAGGAGPVSAVWPGSATSFARVAAKAAGGVYAVVPPPGVGGEEEEGEAAGEAAAVPVAAPPAAAPGKAMVEEEGASSSSKAPAPAGGDPDQPGTPTRWWSGRRGGLGRTRSGEAAAAGQAEEA